MGNGDGNEVAGNKEGDGEGGKGNCDGDEGDGQVMATTRSMAMASKGGGQQKG